MKNSKGLTITEFLIVTLLIAISAAFAVPSYQNAITKARVRDAIVQLSAIHSACMIFESQNGNFPTNTFSTVPTINTALNINLIDDGVITYQYVGDGGAGNTFTATATDGNFVVTVDETNLSQRTGSLNPRCTSGAGTCSFLGIN
mgnify:CR=1 FL=1